MMYQSWWAVLMVYRGEAQPEDVLLLPVFSVQV
jgi:hypothetical protein